jgi:hypothetical protein
MLTRDQYLRRTAATRPGDAPPVAQEELVTAAAEIAGSAPANTRRSLHAPCVASTLDAALGGHAKKRGRPEALLCFVQEAVGVTAVGGCATAPLVG